MPHAYLAYLVACLWLFTPLEGSSTVFHGVCVLLQLKELVSRGHFLTNDWALADSHVTFEHTLLVLRKLVNCDVATTFRMFEQNDVTSVKVDSHHFRLLVSRPIFSDLPLLRILGCVCFIACEQSGGISAAEKGAKPELLMFFGVKDELFLDRDLVLTEGGEVDERAVFMIKDLNRIFIHDLVSLMSVLIPRQEAPSRSARHGVVSKLNPPARLVHKSIFAGHLHKMATCFVKQLDFLPIYYVLSQGGVKIVIIRLIFKLGSLLEHLELYLYPFFHLLTFASFRDFVRLKLIFFQSVQVLLGFDHLPSDIVIHLRENSENHVSLVGDDSQLLVLQILYVEVRVVEAQSLEVALA